MYNIPELPNTIFINISEPKVSNVTEIPEMPIALPQTKPAQVSTMLPRIGDITTIAPADSDSVASETDDIVGATDSTDGSSTTTENTSTEKGVVAKLTCNVGDKTYEEEEEIPSEDPCTLCVCSNGEMLCAKSMIKCPDMMVNLEIFLLAFLGLFDYSISGDP